MIPFGKSDGNKFTCRNIFNNGNYFFCSKITVELVSSLVILGAAVKHFLEDLKGVVLNIS